MENCIGTVPIHLKMTLTAREAAEYSNIGINKIDSMLRTPNCPFVLFVGTKKLVKRKEFEQFISEKLVSFFTQRLEKKDVICYNLCVVVRPFSQARKGYNLWVRI